MTGGYCHQCHHAWLAHDDDTDDGDHCRVCECDGFASAPSLCRCCGLAAADAEDPDGYCIDCGVECADD